VPGAASAGVADVLDAVAADGLTVHVKISDLPVMSPNPLPLHRRCGRDRLENKLGLASIQPRHPAATILPSLDC
jgi:hypothetical protein